MEAAGFVDAQVAGFAHKIGLAALDRLVAEAIARYMPEQALQDARDAAENRHFTIHHGPSVRGRRPASRASSTSPMPWTSTPP